MAKNRFLDLTGLSSFKSKIVELITGHTSDNNIHISSEEKTKLNGIEIEAEKNVIIGLTINGQNMPVDSNKKINVTLEVDADGNLVLTY